MNAKLVLVLVAVLAIAGAYVALPPEMGGGGYLEAWSAGEPIMCNLFEFTCCSEQLTLSTNGDVRDGLEYYRCPTTAARCEVSGSVVGYNPMYMVSPIPTTSTVSSTCKYQDCQGLFCTSDQDYSWICPNDKETWSRTINTLYLNPGDIVHTRHDRTLLLSIKVYENKLFYTGLAGSTIGVPVPGANGCSFVTNEDIYSPSGTIIKKDIGDADISYSVPTGVNSCVLGYSKKQFVCGYTNLTCSSDAQCASKYPYKYTYEGVTYGAMCGGRTLELYGCRQQTKTVAQDQEGTSAANADPIAGSNMLTYQTSGCELYKAIPSQCCPYTNDCGSNAQCDPTTFKCVPIGVVRCKSDYECPAEQGCDRSTKTLYNWFCDKPGTTSSSCQKKTLKAIECCGDKDCQSGWYCNADKKCVQNVPVKIDCPYACCSGDSRFFDRKCGAGSVCCPTNTDKEHECAATLSDCTTKPYVCDNDGKCEPSAGESESCNDCIIIPPPFWNNDVFSGLIAILASILTFSVVYSYRKNPKYKGVLATVIAVIVGVAVFFLVSALTKDWQIDNPFAAFVPQTQTCSTAGLWLGQLDPGFIGCVMGEIGYYLGYFIALIAGGIAAYLLWSTLSRTEAFRDKPLMVGSFAVAAFIVIFLIAKVLALMAVPLVLIFLVLRYVLPGAGTAVGLLGALR